MLNIGLYKIENKEQNSEQDVTAHSVCQEELLLLQTISGCQLYSTCLKKGNGYGPSPSPPWEAGLCPRNIARGAPAPLGVTPFHSLVFSLLTWLCSHAIVVTRSNFTRQQGHTHKVKTQLCCINSILGHLYLNSTKVTLHHHWLVESQQKMQGHQEAPL